MPSADVVDRARHVMTVCNACRYCEQFCPVFPAMENRLTFRDGDLAYLAHLCHNCGECLYACQYAPPHEFGINVPRTLAEVRLESYERFCWPRVMGALFRHHGVSTAGALVAGFVAVMLAAVWWGQREAFWRPSGGHFYAVIPHHVMVALFGGVSTFVVIAIGIATSRFRNALGQPSSSASPLVWSEGVKAALSLRHLHGSGADCTSAEESRSPWRRWFHHLTFYGFMLCFASTSTAAVYHTGFGWQAPYPYMSLPVVLGTLGGIGLLVGPAGLFILRSRRDPMLGDPAGDTLDVALLLLLFLTSVTGVLLLVFREGAAMAWLLIVHLGVVLALFLTLPYGKFLHGLYRTAALIKYARDDAHAGRKAEHGE